MPQVWPYKARKQASKQARKQASKQARKKWTSLRDYQTHLATEAQCREQREAELF